MFNRNIVRSFLENISGFENAIYDIEYDGFDDENELLLFGPAKIIQDYDTNKNIISLTDNQNQVGKLIINNNFTINKIGEVEIIFYFRMQNPDGAGDADGPGADGIKFDIIGDKGRISIFADSYYNHEDSSGNHIDLEINGAKKAEGYVETKLNDGDIKKLCIKCKENILRISLGSDENNSFKEDDDEIENILPIMVYSIDLNKKIGKKINLEISGITGSGYQQQQLLGFEFRSDSYDEI